MSHLKTGGICSSGSGAGVFLDQGSAQTSPASMRLRRGLVQSPIHCT
eukprot:CAMPEP_0179342938 /NCGR_PEP_ID=MMETSP0797-20121207/70700_1 /TAXON_ID=47934 /ORGANISM="Dinophysis acuminata, Strain DAEP01" /LENGTH=46 /DNA_ID= /DNA_START= /DNA_END= /DNA_ORIENTATION=